MDNGNGTGIGLAASLIMLVLIALLFVGSILVARSFERHRKSVSAQNTKPFTWGYFFAISHMAVGIVLGLVLMFGMIVPPRTVTFESGVLPLLLMWSWVAIGYFTVKEKRWAWITLTLLSANVILWIINFTYGGRRESQYK